MPKKMATARFLAENEKKELVRISTAGGIDDGKSTLIGRLLYDTKGVFEDQLASVKKISVQQTSAGFDLALITDGLRAEREQGITIDVAYRYFSTAKRKFILADTPGHEQYTRNMATGASTANLAIILVDARKGVLPQTKRHAFISSLLGVPHIIVAINKMDLVGYRKSVFESIKQDFVDFARRLNMADLRFLPISALKGDNVVTRSSKMPWFDGESLLALLENIHISSDENLVDLRFPVQLVLRPHQNFRGYCGQVVSGILRKGDELLVLPSMQETRVQSIITQDGELNLAGPPLSVAITTEDELDISRGNVLVHKHNLPHVDTHFEAMVVWMDNGAMDLSKPYLIKMGTQTENVRINSVHYKIDVNTLSRCKTAGLKLNEIGRVSFSATQVLFFDTYKRNKAFGGFILINQETNTTAAAGMVIETDPSRQRGDNSTKGMVTNSVLREQRGTVSHQERANRFHQRACVLWLTGLVSSGKTEIAYSLERALFDLGAISVVLDGENIRLGINRDLDFRPAHKQEHMRRVAEMAKLISSAGIIVICAFASPSAEMRKKAKEIVGRDRFFEMHVAAPLAWVENHDKTGLYNKARKGEVRDLPGINASFEAPKAPALVLDVSRETTKESVQRILMLLRDKKVFPYDL